jgi:gamma-glutamyltranspeptidase/glutathione hydrolase
LLLQIVKSNLNARYQYSILNYSRYVADPDFSKLPIEKLLDESYGRVRSEMILKDKVNADIKEGNPFACSDTVSFCVVDKEGNALSFVNSNYMGFGTGIVPKRCGFTLQNRGMNFSLEKGHFNYYEGGKRPYHTIIPGIALKNGNLYCTFNVMGGFMQPQGHVQVLSNMINFGMDPQQALDSARFIVEESIIGIEEGIPIEEVSKLKSYGHSISIYRGMHRSSFGRGQIISLHNSAYWGGSDPRADGCAQGY